MKSVGVLIFDNVDPQHVAAIYRTFAMANDVNGDAARYRCFLVAERLRPMRGIGGLKLLPDCVLLPSPDIDVLVIPGGDISCVVQSDTLVDWIRYQASEAEVTVGIGNGAAVLAKAGLLERGETQHDRNRGWIDCGKVCAYAQDAFDAETGLQLLERVGSKQLAQAALKHLDVRPYAHASNNKRRRAGPGLFSFA